MAKSSTYLKSKRCDFLRINVKHWLETENKLSSFIPLRYLDPRKYDKPSSVSKASAVSEPRQFEDRTCELISL